MVIQNVDTLAGIIMTQLANPGCPAFYGCISSITDLRDMKYLAGAVEMGLMNAGAAQMAQFYKLPFYATAGMSDSKCVDAQAGYESAITSTMVALAGANFIHDAAGFIEFCMTASYDKLVLDNEIIGMIMRAVEGIEVNDTTLAFDEIKKVGPGGHFVSSRHTRKYMRSEQYAPQLSDRNTRDQWLARGGQDTRQRAAARVTEVLEARPENVLTEEVRDWIKREIPAIRPFIME
jgi:trimethylamine---corrinoid protein Co-methyltransferase